MAAQHHHRALADGGVKEYSSVEQTSLTLLERVRACDPVAWARFVHLYTPLVERWCRRAGLQDADASDVLQEVFRVVAGSLAQFRRDRPGDTFRGWLYVVTKNKLRDLMRRQALHNRGTGGNEAYRQLQQVVEADNLAEPETVDEDRRLIYRRAVQLLLNDCEDRAREAFWRVVVQGQAAVEVGQALGLSVNSVYLIKSRLLRRLREEFADCVEL